MFKTIALLEKNILVIELIIRLTNYQYKYIMSPVI